MFWAKQMNAIICVFSERETWKSCIYTKKYFHLIEIPAWTIHPEHVQKPFFSNIGSSDLWREVFHLSPYDTKLLVQFIIYYISHFMLNYDFLFCWALRIQPGWYKNRAGIYFADWFFEQHILEEVCNYSQTAYFLSQYLISTLAVHTHAASYETRLCDVCAQSQQ